MGVAFNMKKSSAITISIIIMLLALAILLGMAAFFIDQSVVYPLVLMIDSDVNLRCYLSLIRVSQSYIRASDIPQEGTLREKLLTSYNIDENIKESMDNEYLTRLGYSGIFFGDEAEFRTFRNNNQIMCYARSFGPARQGYIALYKSNDEVSI